MATFRALTAVQLGISFFAADTGESASAIRMLKTMRYTMLVNVILDAVMLMVATFAPEGLSPGFGKGMAVTVLAIAGFVLLYEVLWTFTYLLVRFSDRGGIFTRPVRRFVRWCQKETRRGETAG